MSLAVVDDNDRVIGSADYDRIHSGGLLHRFVLVYVFDKKGQLFLQKRANSKKHGGLWAESVCAHVKNGENYAQTASRRLAEELGISEMPVEVCKIMVDTKETEWRNRAFVKIYECASSQALKLNPDEVQDGSFKSLDEVRTMFHKNPDLFVPGFKTTFKAYLKNKSS